MIKKYVRMKIDNLNCKSDKHNHTHYSDICEDCFVFLSDSITLDIDFNKCKYESICLATSLLMEIKPEQKYPTIIDGLTFLIKPYLNIGYSCDRFYALKKLIQRYQ